MSNQAAKQVTIEARINLYATLPGDAVKAGVMLQQAMEVLTKYLADYGSVRIGIELDANEAEIIQDPPTDVPN